MKEYISENFKYSEFFPEGTDKVSLIIVRNTETLVKKILQPARYALGRSINIVSGYRSPEHNKTVNGAVNSQHLYGTAADVQVSGMTALNLWKFLLQNFNYSIGGLGLYYPEEDPVAVHVDIRPKVSGMIETWYRDKAGVYKEVPEDYLKFTEVKIAIK